MSANENAEKSMQQENKDCPFCGEIILAKAVKCKHCGEFLNGSNKQQEEGETEEVMGMTVKKEKEEIIHGPPCSKCGAITVAHAEEKNFLTAFMIMCIGSIVVAWTIIGPFLVIYFAIKWVTTPTLTWQCESCGNSMPVESKE